jgi:hypothetical protein
MPMPTNTVRDEWNSYTRELLAGAPPIQIQECRRAFYAGAAAIITLLVTIPDDASEVDHERYVHGLQDELAAFAVTVGTPQEGR